MITSFDGPSTLEIDWLAGELRPRPNNPSRREMFYPVKCWRCDGIRWLRAFDARKSGVCGRCQRSMAGKLGRAAAVAKHGVIPGIEHMAEYQHRWPSRPERRVRKWLKAWGIEFADSVIFQQRWILDVVVGTRAIEVYGYWHKRKAVERDQLVAAAWAGPFLFLDADLVMGDPDAAQKQLREFLALPTETGGDTCAA